jgi:hypothetical protein
VTTLFENRKTFVLTGAKPWVDLRAGNGELPMLENAMPARSRVSAQAENAASPRPEPAGVA